jgi:Ca-activated chloride channel homolog
MFDELTKGIQFFLAQYDLKLMRPEGLLLLLAIPLFVVIAFWMGRDLRWYRRLTVGLLRVALIVALSLALARPVKISTQNDPAVVILTDLSASMDSKARESMKEKMDSIWSQRGKAACFVVGFGQNPTLLAHPKSRRLGELTLPDESQATDIAAALRFSYSLFPPQHDRRVVIFSDGDETRGDLRKEAARARELGIEISSVPIMPASVIDVRLEKITTPATARAGDTLDVEVELSSNSRKTVALQLLLDGKQVQRKKQLVKPGRSTMTFSQTVEGQGWHDLTARAWAKDDRYPENNLATSRVFLTGRPKVLLVQAKTKKNSLRSLLESQELDLRLATLESMPKQLKQLSEHELLILDDLPLAGLSKELVGRLRSYVEELGGGLLITTGQAAAELAGPEDSAIEALLPVHFRQVKKKEKIPAALAFVLDRSSSMSREKKFVILLRAVADALERLRDTAQVAVIMFDDFPDTVVPLTEAKQRKKIKKVVLAQRVGGGTSIFPALVAAHKELKKSAAKLKHVILLSDGQSISIYAHYGYLVEKLAKDKITITSIALGSDSDQAELKRISARSGGRFYFADSMANIPKIFAAETENISEDNVVEQPIRAVPAKLVEVLSGIDFESAPPLKGYVASEARPTSEVLLKSSDRSEPLLARWRFGLGRVAIMTTDAQGSWAADWVNWQGFSVLWPRLVKDTMRSSPPGDLRLAGKVEQDRAILTVRVPAERSTDKAEPPQLMSIGLQGHETELEVVRRGLGVYRADLELDRLGPYAFRARRTSPNGAEEIAYASLNRTYKEEYLAASGNLALLKAVVRTTGGQLAPSPAEIFRPGRQERQGFEEKWPLFVFLALGLFLAEVLVRRL